MNKTGGKWHAVAKAKCTPKAAAQFDELSDGTHALGDVLRIVEQTGVRRQSDTSPYYIFELGDLRYVFCVNQDHAGGVPEDGRFRCVTVQRRYDK